VIGYTFPAYQCTVDPAPAEPYEVQYDTVDMVFTFDKCNNNAPLSNGASDCECGGVNGEFSKTIGITIQARLLTTDPDPVLVASDAS
jgi:hypothetical protein